MKRHCRLFALTLLGACLAIAAGCGSNADVRNDAEPPAEESQSVVLLVFDPTILDLSETASLKEWLDGLAEFYMTLPENSRIVVFLVDKGISQKSPLEDMTFGVNPEFQGEERHKKQLADHFAELRPRLEAAWKSAHAAEAIKKPTSCIASSLYASNKYLASYAHAKTKYRFFLVLVSDMMESCDEWGKPINIEKGTAELDHLRQVTVDLSQVSRAVVVQVPNHFLVTPVESESISAFWHSFFEKAGVKPEALIYSSSFPMDLDFGPG